MRFDLSDFSACKISGSNFLKELYEAGITSFHSSQEYDTFQFFSSCLKEFNKHIPKYKLQHIVKIAAPHFKDNCFSIDLLQDRIDKFLLTTGAETIDAVQWLVRNEPNTDNFRLPILNECVEHFTHAMNVLKATGKVRSWYSFPYSSSFAREVMRLVHIQISII